jgi:hypothetical protein
VTDSNTTIKQLGNGWVKAQHRTGRKDETIEVTLPQAAIEVSAGVPLPKPRIHAIVESALAEASQHAADKADAEVAAEAQRKKDHDTLTVTPLARIKGDKEDPDRVTGVRCRITWHSVTREAVLPPNAATIADNARQVITNYEQVQQTETEALSAFAVVDGA